MKNDGLSILVASDRLKNMPSLMQKSVEKNSRVIQFMPQLTKDADTMLTAGLTDPALINFSDAELKSNKDFMKKAFIQNVSTSSIC